MNKEIVNNLAKNFVTKRFFRHFSPTKFLPIRQSSLLIGLKGHTVNWMLLERLNQKLFHVIFYSFEFKKQSWKFLNIFKTTKRSKD